LSSSYFFNARSVIFHVSLIDTQISGVRDAVNTINNDIEAAKSLINNLQSLVASGETTNKQTEDIKAQMLAVLESIRNQASAANENANQIGALKAEAEQSKAQGLAVLEAMRNQANMANENASRVEAIKTEAEQTQAVIAKKNAHIEDGRKHVDSVRVEIDTVLNEAKQSATNAEGQYQSAHDTAETISQLYTEAQTTKANTDSIAETVATTRTAVEGHAVITKGLADIAKMTEENIAAYEKRLKSLAEESRVRLKVIDDLLPGATSAGLASAYEERSKSFKKPQRIWQGVFTGSLIAVLVLVAFMEMHWGETVKSAQWDGILRMLLLRLPFVLPLVWLAIHAARQASMAKQMEEEYAFKATTSKSFEGYRRQMAEAGKDSVKNPALAQFLADATRIIATSPGKVYDKHRMDPTPGTAAADAVSPIIKNVVKVQE
jgi:DNA repair exonuclease SbcCD ATPase subunit